MDDIPAADRVRGSGSSRFERLESRTRFRFAEFELDPANWVLRRHGAIVKVGPQPLKALTLLVSRAGDLVTREELRRVLWDDQTNVDYEHGLNTCIRQLRLALGGEAGAELIETAPRLGYRFKAEVQRVELALPAPPTTNWRLQRVAAAVCTVVIVTVATGITYRSFAPAERLARIRLAVLPLPLEGGEADVWTRGLAEDLMARLQAVEGVQVIAEASAFAVRRPATSLRQVGARLGADAILTLSARRASKGRTFEIAATLVGLPAERQIWSEQVARPDQDVFAVQAEITRKVASVLRRRLAPIERRWPTEDPDTYELYLRGRAAGERGTNEGTRLALQLFDQAIARDPAFAHVYAAIAEIYLGAPTPPIGRPLQEAYERGTAAAGRALALDPLLPDAHLAGARVKSAVLDWPGAEQEYRRAIELAPNRTIAREQYAMWLSLHGRFSEANAEADRAVLLDPLSPRAHYTAGLVRRFARRCQEARPHLERALELDPQYGAAEHETAQCYELSGQFDLAIEAYRRADFSAGNLGHALAAAGRSTEARMLLAKIIERYDRTGSGAGLAAQIYIGLGEYGHALDWIDKSMGPMGMPRTLKVAAVWDPLRSHPRFAEFLRRSGLESDHIARR